jgi:hypothetical protein
MAPGVEALILSRLPAHKGDKICYSYAPASFNIFTYVFLQEEFDSTVIVRSEG